MEVSQLLAFTGIALLLTLTPGADTLLVIRNTMTGGRNDGLWTTLGICSGLLVHASFAGLGLSVILVKSATAFSMVKYIGGGYLVFLGIQSLWRAVKKGSPAPEEIMQADAETLKVTYRSRRRSYLNGFLTNVLNPKVALFYLSFLPQFINPAHSVFAQAILLAGIHLTQGLIWLGILSYSVGRLRGVLSKSSVRRALDSLTGALLVGLGLKLIYSRN